MNRRTFLGWLATSVIRLPTPVLDVIDYIAPQTLSKIVAYTIRIHSASIIANIEKHNALLKRLKELK